MQRLYRFLAPKDPDAARRAVSGIREGVKILARHARAGRPIEGMDVAFREWPIDFGSSGYVVLYRVDGDHVSLLAIRHQKEAGY
ncbi:MAG TPA: type II toxin-antitoxin system RelE/ParE family toxin [Oleiagrimonas sp.]|nr:type II toxin-antitoxin system RelE/ParE family toxin [Oleiagrimonas sp.]